MRGQEATALHWRDASFSNISACLRNPPWVGCPLNFAPKELVASSYVVLARRWRPAQFSDIVGQGHVVRTMMNAIRSERVHQAYLMTGSRGIGKTSIARIFAKAMRCPNTTWQGEGAAAWLHSCDQCASCREIASGTSVDVIEIDGASNNGVDAVREIRESAKFMPASGNRKIYIIDEVHMLTTAAFNALLKTLEEPPPHVIFVFATTEPHKIPATILSRCQRFDLRRLSSTQIQDRLTEVSRAEKIEAEPGALALMARAAEGGMRDAMSLLDQVVAYADGKITVQIARESIGLIEGQSILGVVEGIFARKPLEALALVEQAYRQGHDLRVLTRSLIEFLHGTLLAKIGAPSSSTLELSEDEWNELKRVAELRPLEDIELIFQVLHQGMDWIARSPQPKTVLDVLLIKCATGESLAYAAQVAAPSTGGGSPAQGLQTVKTPVAPIQNPGRLAGASPAPGLTPVRVVMGPAHAPMSADDALTMPVSAKPLPTAPAVETQAPAVPLGPPPSFSSSAEGYERFIAHVRQARPLLASLLENGICTQIPGQSSSENPETDLLILCFRPEDAYYRDQLQSRVYGEQMNSLIKEFFRRQARLRIELRETGETLAGRRERELGEKEQAAREAAHNHPIIAEARALFGGELGPIELMNANP